MSQKQSTSACTHIRIHSEMEKKTSSHLEIIYFINIYNKTPPKNEMMMKTKPCIE